MLWQALYLAGFLLLAGMAVALIYFNDYPAFLGLAVAWVVVFAATVLARRRIMKLQTKP
jgi:hypothetical protein